MNLLIVAGVSITKIYVSAMKWYDMVDVSVCYAVVHPDKILCHLDCV